MTLTSEFIPLTVEELPALAAEKKADGWRFVQLLAVNTEDGIDLVYSFMKDNVLANHEIKGVQKGTTVPSITDQFLAAFVFENETHDLFGVDISDIAIDFGGNFYALAQKEPMTIISPEQKAAREKAKKLAAAKAAKERQAAALAANAEYLVGHPDAKPESKPRPVVVPSGEDDLDARLAGVDPEKVARVKAALAAKAKKAAEAETAAKNAELEEKLAGMDPEKVAKVRAAMEAKAAREAAAAQKEGE